MNPFSQKKTWAREELLHLLSLSGTLAGLCITGVALFRTMGNVSLSATIADDMLTISALLFLICTYAIFFALRGKSTAQADLCEKIADGLFLLALTGMVAAGFVMAYTIL